MVCPLLDLEGAAQQIPSGHALQHHGGGLLVADPVGHRHQAIRGHQPLLGIGAKGRCCVGDPVPDLEIVDPLADLQNLARRFEAGGEGEAGGGIETGSEIDVDEIEADGGLFQSSLPRTGLRDLNILVAQNVRPAGLVNAYRPCHR